MKRLELTLSSDYVPTWTIVDAIRELFQNAIDQGRYTWSYADETLTLTNWDAALTTKTLLLGSTTKREDDAKIGQFGEGYKIATLVLLRESKGVEIRTGDEVWQPRFVKSRRYCSSVLTFFIDKAPTYSPDLVVTVTGLTEDEWELIAASNLAIRNDHRVLHQTPIGQILDLPGHVFVGGLLIKIYSPYTYGYNFNPGVLSLDRDRKLVSDFDLKWIAARMWSYTEGAETEILGLLMMDAADVMYLPDLGSTPRLEQTALENFVEQYGEYAIPVSTQLEVESAPANYKTVVVPESLKRIIQRVMDISRGTTRFERWLEKYEHLLPPGAVDELKDIIG